MLTWRDRFCCRKRSITQLILRNDFGRFNFVDVLVSLNLQPSFTEGFGAFWLYYIEAWNCIVKFKITISSPNLHKFEPSAADGIGSHVWLILVQGKTHFKRRHGNVNVPIPLEFHHSISNRKLEQNFAPGRIIFMFLLVCALRGRAHERTREMRYNFSITHTSPSE